MMKNKPFRLILCLLFVFVCMLPVSLTAGAKNDYENYLLGKSPYDIGQSYDYLNEDTGYRVCIIDEDELLEKESYLVKYVQPLTKYASVIFWSTRVSETQQDTQVDEWRDGEYAKDSIILTVNLEEGFYNLYSSGAVYRAIPKDRLTEINSGLSQYANESEFDTLAQEGFSQVYQELSGEEMPIPQTTADEGVRYTDPDTGYQVMILDDAELLTEEEETKLVEDMKPITGYGHIIFWSTNESAPDAEIQAREKRWFYYGYDSAGIFSINLSNRKVVFHADGAMYEAVNASDARSITDNVSGYATSKDYYTCAKEGFHQVYQRLMGQAIAEPMKYTSYVIIALMLAFVIVVGLVFGVFNPLNKKNKDQARLFGSGALLASEPMVRRTGSETRAWVTILMILITSIFESGHGGGGGGHSGGGGGGGSHGGGGGGSSSF